MSWVWLISPAIIWANLHIMVTIHTPFAHSKYVRHGGDKATLSGNSCKFWFKFLFELIVIDSIRIIHFISHSTILRSKLMKGSSSVNESNLILNTCQNKQELTNRKFVVFEIYINIKFFVLHNFNNQIALTNTRKKNIIVLDLKWL